jgi:hypothetical protein
MRWLRALRGSLCGLLDYFEDYSGWGADDSDFCFHWELLFIIYRRDAETLREKIKVKTGDR